MFIRQHLSKLGRYLSPRRTVQTPRRQSRLGVEILEERAMLTGNAGLYLVNGVAQYYGGDVSVSQANGQVVFSSPDDLIWLSNGGFAGATGNGQNTASIDARLVQSIQVADRGNEWGNPGTVNVLSADVPVAVSTGLGDQVNVGNSGSLTGIWSPVTIANSAGALTYLRVDDGADIWDRQGIISDTSVAIANDPMPWAVATPHFATVNYAAGSLNGLTVMGGQGGDDFSVANTPGGADTQLYGGGDNTIDVIATTGSFTYNTAGGTDRINLGDTGGTARLQGPITINGDALGNPNVHLTVDDHANQWLSRIVTVSDVTYTGQWGLSYYYGSITGLGAPITYDPTCLASLTVDGGNAGNTFIVNNPDDPCTSTLNTGFGKNNVLVEATGGPLTVNDQGGKDEVTVASSSDSLDSIANGLTVNGGGATTLRIDDWASTPLGPQYTVTDSAVTRTCLQLFDFRGHFVLLPVWKTIAYTSLGTLVVNTSNVGSVVSVESTPAFTAINAGAGDDIFLVGPTAHNLDHIGTVIVNGGGGNNALTVNDQASSAILTTDTVTGADLTRVAQKLTYVSGIPVVFSFVASVQYTGMSHITLLSGIGQTLIFDRTPAGSPAATFIGGAGPNVLFGPDWDTIWKVTSQNAGSVGTASFSSMQTLTGGKGADGFYLGPNGVVTGRIDGGSGVNTLDYVTYAANVVCNLALGQATAVSGGVANVQNVVGGLGTNLLVGNAGSNTLIAGKGRSVLIGGGGSDRLIGGASDDLLVGGSTAFDSNAAALAAILAEWTRTDLAYYARIAHLDGAAAGGLNGSSLLTGQTIADDKATDTLTGNGGLDWFSTGTGDKITDLASGERVN
jgi:hypothetical protein